MNLSAIEPETIEAKLLFLSLERSGGGGGEGAVGEACGVEAAIRA